MTAQNSLQTGPGAEFREAADGILSDFRTAIQAGAQDIIAGHRVVWGEEIGITVAFSLGNEEAAKIIAKLTDSGYRLLSPGAVDPQTTEKCAALIEENMLCGEDGEVLRPRTNSGNKLGLAYAEAIRGLTGSKKT